jgi:hypothetical protein
VRDRLRIGEVGPDGRITWPHSPATAAPSHRRPRTADGIHRGQAARWKFGLTKENILDLLGIE